MLKGKWRNKIKACKGIECHVVPFILFGGEIDHEICM